MTPRHRRSRGGRTMAKSDLQYWLLLLVPGMIAPLTPADRPELRVTLRSSF